MGVPSWNFILGLSLNVRVFPSELVDHDSASGALIHANTEDKKREAYEQGKSEAVKKQQSTGTMPNLKNPKVEARWIDGKVIGNRYVDGHFEYVIVEQARWEEL